MLRKFTDFCRCNGLGNTTQYVLNALQKRCAYYRCVTEFFYCEPDGEPPSLGNAGTEFRTVDNVADLDAFEYPRMKYLPRQRWFREGSKCYVGLVDGRLVSYCWVHSGSYPLGHMGLFRLRETDAWVGPVFVDKRFRGRGVNTAQIKYVLATEKRICRFVTAISSTNHGSRRSFEKCAFVKIGDITTTTLFGLPLCKVMTETGPVRISECLV